MLLKEGRKGKGEGGRRGDWIVYNHQVSITTKEKQINNQQQPSPFRSSNGKQQWSEVREREVPFGRKEGKEEGGGECSQTANQ